MNRWRFHWNQLREKLWFTVGLYAVAGGVLALAAVLFAPLVSQDAAIRFGKFEAVEALLTILASSLLAVATFSLGAMVSAYTAVGSGATPRVTAIVVGDRQTQRALATFIGGFLFAIVSLVAVEASYYGAQGRAIIYFGTLALIALVAWRLLQWTNHLGQLARMSYMLDQLEARATDAMRGRIEAPQLGGAPIDPYDRDGFDRLVRAGKTGYVQNIDSGDLQATAEDCGVLLELAVLPGTFVAEGHVLARVRGGDLPGDFDQQIRDGFVIGHNRTFDQDVRFGLVVFGEIAARALSPAVNDPGTAIAVTGVAVRMLKRWAETDWAACEVRHDRLRVPNVEAADLIDDILGPVARYGAGDVAASVRLHKALEILKACDDREMAKAADRFARVALERSRHSMPIEDDLRRVMEANTDERADMT